LPRSTRTSFQVEAKRKTKTRVISKKKKRRIAFPQNITRRSINHKKRQIKDKKKRNTQESCLYACETTPECGIPPTPAPRHHPSLFRFTLKSSLIPLLSEDIRSNNNQREKKAEKHASAGSQSGSAFVKQRRRSQRFTSPQDASFKRSWAKGEGKQEGGVDGAFFFFFLRGRGGWG
jgi:hypothetical protein